MGLIYPPGKIMSDAIKRLYQEKENWSHVSKYLFSIDTKKGQKYVGLLISSAQVGVMTPQFKNFQQYSNINLPHVFSEPLGLILNHCQMR